MASNVQAGTRGLSAGDWIRLKRLQAPRGAVYYKSGVTSPPPAEYNKDITNSVLRLEPESGRRVYTEFGTSKIRRPASSWTDYIASQTADYVLESQNTETKSRELAINNVCRCNITHILTKLVNGQATDTVTLLDSSESSYGMFIGSPVYFTNLTVEGTIVKNNVQFYLIYVDTVGGFVNFSFSQTPGGAPVNVGDDGADTTNATLYILPLPTASAIKHNGVCVKCKHS